MGDYTNPYALTAQYSPQTTVQINLRQFEKDSKSRAEREYDEEHGPLPEPPADDDLSVDPATRQIQKKKRKVRSAIVSRRKSAIYVEKLEAELEMRDNINADLETRLGVFRDVLRETSARIQALQQTMEVRNCAVPVSVPVSVPVHDVQKRARPHYAPNPHHAFPQPQGTPTDHHQLPTAQHPPRAPFFPGEDPIDDILSFSPDEILPCSYQNQHPQAGHAHAHQHPQHIVQHSRKEENVVVGSGMHRITDFSSECSGADGQTSPVTPKQGRYDVSMSHISIRDESQWKAPPLVNRPIFSAPMGYRTWGQM